MENITKTAHPLILVAAASVSIASLAAAAHFTGLIPARSSDPLPASVAAVAAPVPAAAPVAQLEAPAPAAAPEAAKPQPPRQAERPRHTEPPRYTERPRHTEPAHQAGRADEEWRPAGGTHRVSTNNAGIDVIPSSSARAPTPAQAPAVCHDCGMVESVREVAAKGEGSGLGAIAGGVLGGVLGNQVGGGKGKDLATIAGAVGGAFAGHEVEKNVRSEKQFQVAVRFDDGSVRTYNQANAAWRTGDRVRLANGSLVSASGSPER